MSEYELHSVTECVGCDKLINREIRAINRLYGIKYDYECLDCLSESIELSKNMLTDEGFFWIYADKRKCLWDDIVEYDDEE